MVASPDFVILGGGIAGSAVAIELAERGDSVELVAANEGSISLAAGVFVTIMPENLMQLVKESMSFYERNKCLKTVISRGSLVIADKRRASRILSIHSEWGFPTRIISFSDLEDELRERLVLEDGEELLYTDEFLFDVGKLIECLYKRMRSLGVALSRAKVKSLNDISGLARGSEVIVAAGAYTGLLIGELREKSLIYRCQALTVNCQGISVILEDLVNGFYSVPVEASSSIIGDGSNEILDSPFKGYVYDLEDAYTVLEKYARRVRGAESCYIGRVWSGPCIVGRDGYPLLGRVGDVIVATGFNGSGLSLAPGSAALLADYIEGKIRSVPGHLDCSRDLRFKPSKILEPYDLV